MLVPEASVDKDDLLPTCKDQIWATREIAAVKAVPISLAENDSPHRHLDRRVLAADARHHLTSFVGREYVHH